MKTVVLGFDALDFRYLDRFADAVPNITALRERGVEAPLESTHPPWTGSAWPSMYTGTDPSHHGVYGFFSYDAYPDDGTLVSRTDVDRPAIWDYLSQKSIPSIVMNVPVTHPATNLEGTLLPGYLATEDAPGYPDGIRTALNDRLGEPYRIYSRHETADDPAKKFKSYLELIDLRRRAACSLLSTNDWECALLQVQKTDAVFHNFETDDRFRAIYTAADRLVGDVLDMVDDETTVILCSDHGIGPVDGFMIYVNEVLRQHGFLETTTDGDHLTLESEKPSLLAGETTDQETAPVDQTLYTARRVLERFGITPDDIYTVAERLGIEAALVRVTPDSVRQAAADDVDWRRSRAYCADPTRLGVRVNLAGREPAGIVPEAEYEAVRSELIDVLSHLRTPAGEPAFEFVCRREKRYDGPHTDAAPDVLFRPAGMNHKISTTLYGRQFVPVDVFDHKVDGAFVGAGPAFTDRVPERLSLTDVAPIAMATLGEPVPERMTGRVPEELVTTTVRRDRYDDHVAPPSEDPDEDPDDTNAAVTERLEDLGYL